MKAEQFILRSLLVFAAATLFGPLMMGCYATTRVEERGTTRLRFYSEAPGPGNELFVCGYRNGYSPDAPLECIDWPAFAKQMEATEQEVPPMQRGTGPTNRL